MSSLWNEENLAITGLAPVADAFAGTVYSDIVDAGDAQKITFLRYHGVGATGTSTITVEACDDTSGSNTSAVAFRYRRVADTSSSDVPGALTAATSAGFATTAGSNQIYIIEVDAAVLAASGYRYVRLKNVEVVDSPVLGGILVVLSGLRVKQGTPASMID